MSLSAEAKAAIVAEYAQGANDTGSPEVQVALLNCFYQPFTRSLC